MSNIYTNKEIYDNKGDHIYWITNGYRFGAIDYKIADKQNFKFDYEIPLDLEYKDYKTEVRNGLTRLYKKYQKTLAICISGRDSEVILREAVDLGIPCKMYFLDLWGMNNWMLDIVKDISRELATELVVVTLSEKHCMEEVIFKSYNIMSALKPTYLCIPYLFEKIPKEEFIIVGEGDLAKDNPAFKYFYPDGAKGGIPMLSTEIVYRMWAQKNERFGEYYFHSSTPELVLSAYNDPLINRTPPSIYTNVMYEKYWPELKFRIKTLNWENGPEKNELIRTILFNLGIQKEKIVGALVPHSSVIR